MTKARNLPRRAILAGAAGGRSAGSTLGDRLGAGGPRAQDRASDRRLRTLQRKFRRGIDRVRAAGDRGLQSSAKGMTVEYLIGDHQNNSDIALNIVREWFDRGDVDAVLEVNNSAIALALNNLCTQKDKVHLNSGAVTADLTGKSCSPNMVHWTYDSWMLTPRRRRR